MIFYGSTLFCFVFLVDFWQYFECFVGNNNKLFQLGNEPLVSIVLPHIINFLSSIACVLWDIIKMIETYLSIFSKPGSLFTPSHLKSLLKLFGWRIVRLFSCKNPDNWQLGWWFCLILKIVQIIQKETSKNRTLQNLNVYFLRPAELFLKLVVSVGVPWSINMKGNKTLWTSHYRNTAQT